MVEGHGREVLANDLTGGPASCFVGAHLRHGQQQPHPRHRHPASAGVTATVLALGSSVAVGAVFALLLIAGVLVVAGAFAASAALLVTSLSVDACKRLAWRL